MQTETTTETTAIDTNEEYIVASNAVKQPPVLSSIFRSIFIETPKDFFVGIFGFFARYIRHFIDGFKYFWSPSLKVAPFEDKDFKEDSQRTFELALILTAILIFMIKQNMIPVNEELQETYGNDIAQMFMEFAIFLMFGVAYLAMILVSVLVGRLFRLLFKIPVSRKEADILFSYFNNSLFSISVLIAFVFRCGIQFEEVKEDQAFANNVASFYFLIFLPVVILWALRFSKLNPITGVRKVAFLLVSVLFFTVFFCLTSYAVTMFILGT